MSRVKGTQRRNVVRRIAPVAFVAVVSIVGAGCGSSSKPASNTTPAGTTTPAGSGTATTAPAKAGGAGF